MIKEITRNIFFGATLAGKTTNEVFEQWELDAPTRPRFGRNWWYWKPPPQPISQFNICVVMGKTFSKTVMLK
jgi:hypothetical protein